MTRRLIVLVAAGFACVSAGCFRDSLRTAFGSPVTPGEVVETRQLSPAEADVAERVSDVGEDLLAATPLGVPVVDFFTVGSEDPELFHRDTTAVFVSDGMVSRCKTDDELAAVLATEVGRLTAEFRREVRKQAPDPMPAVASAPKLDGSTDFDPAQAVYLAQYDREKRAPADKLGWPTVDAKAIAAELLRNYGRDPKLLDDVAPLVKEADGRSSAGRHLGGGGNAPTWSW